MKSYLLFFCVILSNLMMSQELTIGWEIDYGESYQDRFFSIIENQKGELVAVGQRISGLRKHALFCRIDPKDGRLIDGFVTGQQRQEETIVYDVAETPEGHYLLAGYLTSNKKSKSNGLLYKMNEYGKSIWKGSAPMIKAFTQVIQNGDGEIFAVGITHNNKSCLLKFDTNNGHLMWSKQLDNYTNEKINTITLTSQNKIVVASHQKLENVDISYLYQINSDGTQVWKKPFLHKRITDIAVNQTGSIVMVGIDYSSKNPQSFFQEVDSLSLIHI